MVEMCNVEMGGPSCYVGAWRIAYKLFHRKIKLVNLIEVAVVLLLKRQQHLGVKEFN
jgi:hypothetical protein